MRKFDTNVQELKYLALRETVKLANIGKLSEAYYHIPRKIVPDDYETTRCCIYKARAIVEERVRMAMGGDKNNPNIIETISIACDECRDQRYIVSELCRGCITHKCQEVCKFDAISLNSNHHAVIDGNKCKECGKCKNVCPYGAIIEHICPCMVSCKTNAISINEQKKAVIDLSKCVMCGACVYNCPFGAIADKSYILDVFNILKESNKNKNFKVYAMIAPSIVSQFKYAKIEQIVTGIKKIGFHDVVEVAFGADVVLTKEAKELLEKKILTTSCCPSFVMEIEKHFPNLKKYISTNRSPMIETARFIKKTDPTSKVVFIGPCISKKQEIRRDELKGIVDAVITFEELQAFLDGNDIIVENLEETVLDNGSYYGRIFAKSSGITEGVKHVLEKEEFNLKPLILNGLEECKIGLLKFDKNLLDVNFIEGMACVGGCINGAGCLHHGDKNAVDVDNYGREAMENDLLNSVNLYKMIQKEE
ncbi:MAG: 4Fe-4S dicluster domain-containing protein [Bacilli bacterium]|nr:4Fe-4S dicluster domain-containing protein [Bacilli bacterium]